MASSYRQKNTMFQGLIRYVILVEKRKGGPWEDRVQNTLESLKAGSYIRM